MAKKRVYELAKDLGLSNKEMVDWLKAHEYDVKSHSSSLEDDQAQAVTERFRGERVPKAAAPKASASGVVLRRKKADTLGPDGQPLGEHAEPPPPPPPPPPVAEVRLEPVPTPPPEIRPEPVRAPEPAAAQAAPAPAPAAPAPAPAPEVERRPEPAVAVAVAVPVAAPAPIPPPPAAPARPEPVKPAQQSHVSNVPVGDQKVAAKPAPPPPPRIAGRAPGAQPSGPIIRGPGGTQSVQVSDPAGARPTATRAVVLSRPLIPIARPPPRPGPGGGGFRPRPVGEVRELAVVSGGPGRGREFIDVTKDKQKGKKGPRVEKVESLSKQDLVELAKQRAYVPIRGHTKRSTKKGKQTEITEMAEQPEDFQSRPPVVTIMGHVDHGKTSLLDAIRKAHVAEGEAGGITQHIGAYSVEVVGSDGGEADITFLDTPGHEAFTAMRARGANVTDIAVLVIAADDGVMPQTVESINHAKAAEVVIVVAINKIDKPEAQPDRIKQQLSEHALVPEEWGGDTMMIPVSARTGEGLEKLLEAILLQAEVLELKANPRRPAKGVVVEAKLEKGRGPVATVLVQDGTLHVGDPIVTGIHSGHVRAMMNEHGEQVDDVPPGFPVEVLGLDGAPGAGDEFNVVEDETAAATIAEHRALKAREKDLSKSNKLSLEDLLARGKKDQAKTLKVIVKADVQGSAEALKAALTRLATPKVGVDVIHSGVGNVTESDVMLGAASKALVVGFNVKSESGADESASSEGVQIKHYSIIYEALDEVKLAMEGLLDAIIREKVVGHAKVQQLFNVPKLGTIAGSSVTDGKVTRTAMVRLLRDSKPIFTGKIASLRRFKDDVKEVDKGFECGIGIENFNDLKEGDIIEAYELETIRPSLT